MTHVAHACVSCGSLTIYAADAKYPRRCAHCHVIVHRAPDAELSASAPARRDHTEGLLRRLAGRARVARTHGRPHDDADRPRA